MTDRSDPRPRVALEGPRLVTVFGGGIAGLTAAHELADRGFAVQLVERATEVDERGRPELALGGLARSQYRRVPTPATRAELDLAARGHLAAREAHRREAPSLTVVTFEAARVGDGLTPTAAGLAALTSLAEHLAGPLRDYSIVLAGHADAETDDPDEGRASQRLSEARALAVERWLVEAGVAAVRIASRRGEGCRAPLVAAWSAEDRAPNRRVEARLVEAILPGEHGFRFFPAFYRHVADSMRRTPTSEGTVHDALRAMETQLFATAGAPAASLSRGRRGSLAELGREVAAWLEAQGFTPRDVAFYLLRLLRFLTTSSERREHAYEGLSWWDFLTLERLDAREPGGARLPFSEGFLAYLRHSPRALVAMDAVRSDARTQGNIVIQLLRDQVARDGPIDATLDGPTSTAWLGPWRRHLERQGVRFFHGQLRALGEPRSEGGRSRLRPSVDEATPGGLAGYRPEADYYVVALDLVAAEEVTRSLRAFAERAGLDAGVVRDLASFALTAPDPAGGPPRSRDPETEVGKLPGDRLQTMSGAQFYLGQTCRFAEGFVYYARSPWALTSVEQGRPWGRPLRLERDGYLALHSVDIGDFLTPAPEPLARSAWASSKHELAGEVWRQIRGGLTGERVPDPLWFHLDDGLEFADGPDGPGTGPVARNRTPYLVNVVGDWSLRPRGEPRAPRGPTVARVRSEALWQGAHGGYLVHFDQVVFAGTYLRTFTRLTSMEAANESARHAVNAVLEHVAERLGGAAGDACPIWDPERHELSEADFLREADALLLAKGLPHAADILDLDELPLALADDEPDPIGALLRHLAGALDRASLPGDAGSSLDRLVELLRDELED